MIVRFKKNHPNAVTPSYAKPGDNGLDLTAVSYRYVQDTECAYHEYDLGVSVEVPPGHVGLLFPRSSSSKTDLVLANSTGVIDSSFRGNLTARYKEVYRPGYEASMRPAKIYAVGDRVVQLVVVPCPVITVMEAEELSSTERGDGGWGSSGR